MDRSNNLHQSRIDWETIKEDDFNRVVESLLLKLHYPNAFVLDGRGGDGGIDVGVRADDGKITTIYQLKHFREGFSGEWRKARGPQIKGSFETAWENHKPDNWRLVMPRNPTKGEISFVEGLAGDKPLIVDIWGQGKLDVALAEFPSIERAALHHEAVGLVRQMGQEKAALVGSEDLTERAEALAGIADSRSQYWSTSYVVSDGIEQETYTPKHPDAMEKEPIYTSITLNFGPEHEDVAEKLKHAIDYGAFEEVDVPSSAASFKREGPNWVKPLPKRIGKNDSLKYLSSTEVPEIDEILTLNVVDARGYSKGRFEGRVRRRTRGRVGVSVQAVFAHIVTVVFIMPHDSSAPGRLDFSYQVSDALVADIATALDLSSALRTNAIAEIYFRGKRAMKVKVTGEDHGFELDPFEDELLGDLLFLQQQLSPAQFVYPAEVTRRARVMLRVGRLLLEGYSTTMPPQTAVTAVLSGDTDDRLEKLLNEGAANLNHLEAFDLEVQGSKYDLGPAAMFHNNVEVVEAKAAIKALQAGTAAGMAIKIRPRNDELIHVWLRSPSKLPVSAPEYRPWNLAGFEVEVEVEE